MQGCDRSQVQEPMPTPPPPAENMSNIRIDATGPDPWKHRSKKMRCATCMWYVEKSSGNMTILGRCRRHAPTMSGYPVVFPTDWCGDHKLDETKI